MKIENGQARLERGEKAFPCTYLGAEVCQGNRKSDGSPFAFAKHRCYLHLQTKDGQPFQKLIEAVFDVNYKPEVELYKECFVVFGIKNDPTKLPSVIAFVADKSATPVNAIQAHTVPNNDVVSDELIPTTEPTPFGE